MNRSLKQSSEALLLERKASCSSMDKLFKTPRRKSLSPIIRPESIFVKKSRDELSIPDERPFESKRPQKMNKTKEHCNLFLTKHKVISSFQPGL